MILRYWKIIAAVALVVVLVCSVKLYAAREYRRGYAAAQIEQERAVAAANSAARAKEHQMQTQLIKERKEFEHELQKRDAAYTELRTVSERLRYTIARRAGKNPAATAGDDGAAQGCWVVLAESISGYEEMARKADDLNSRLSIAQKWARVVAAPQ